VALYNVSIQAGVIQHIFSQGIEGTDAGLEVPYINRISWLNLWVGLDSDVARNRPTKVAPALMKVNKNIRLITQSHNLP
jgi:hypothetical protein